MAGKNSLKKEKDFERLIRGGKSFKGEDLILKAIKNDFGQTRFAFSVSKKISLKATVRNKLKRRLKNIISQEKKAIKEGFDILFVPLPGFEKINFSEMRKEVKNLLLKAKISENV